jgi:hypothetical protein
VGPMDVEVDSGEKVGIEHDKRVVEGHQWHNKSLSIQQTIV